MALITGLPDFFNAARPADTDLNNATKAILQQTGGSYYDEAAAAYVASVGNLDSNNLASSPGLLNNQKAEPYSHFFIATTSWNGQDQVSPAFAAKLVHFQPILYPATIMAATWIDTRGGEAGGPFINGGSISIYINCNKFGSIPFTNNTINSGATAVGFPIGVDINSGDLFTIDFSGATFSATPTAAYGRWNLHCKLLHI